MLSTVFCLILTVQAYIRPIGVYLPTFIYLSLIGYTIFRKNIKLIPVFMVYLLLSNFLIGIWCYRNYQITGITDFSLLIGANLYKERAGCVVALKENKPMSLVRKEFGDHANFTLKSIREGNRDEYLFMKKKAVDIILGNPVYALNCFSRGCANLLFEPGLKDIFYAVGAIDGPFLKIKETIGNLRNFQKLRWLLTTKKGLSVSIGIIWLFVLYCTNIIFFVKRGIAKLSANIIIIWTIVLYFIVTSANLAAYSRFRLPFEIFIVIFASAVLDKNNFDSYKKKN